MDLIVRNSNLPDGRKGVDIGIEGGRIVAVQPQLEAAATQEIDATGRLATPPFVDAHIHLDVVLSLAAGEINQSGTLIEAIGIWSRMKPEFKVGEIVDRALRYCEWAIGKGILAIRSHVDICDPDLVGVHALLEVKKCLQPFMDLQLVAFPQDGYFRYPGGVELLNKSLALGVDVVGGIPHFERTMEEGSASVRALCRTAADLGLPVDMHCDETDDPNSRHVETLAAEALRLGLRGRATGSHLTSMHSMDNYYVSKLIPLMADADLGVVSNPLTNAVVQGRHDSYPKRRGMTRVPELIEAGLTVAFGHDCCLDPFYGLGSADMLDVAHMAVHLAQMTGQNALHQCFAAVTENPARLLGLKGYGIAPGCFGDIVILQAADPVEAIRLRSTRLFVIRRGKVIAKSSPSLVHLDLAGKSKTLEFTWKA